MGLSSCGSRGYCSGPAVQPGSLLRGLSCCGAWKQGAPGLLRERRGPFCCGAWALDVQASTAGSSLPVEAGLWVRSPGFCGGVLSCSERGLWVSGPPLQGSSLAAGPCLGAASVTAALQTQQLRACGLSCSVACGMPPDQESNWSPCSDRLLLIHCAICAKSRYNDFLWSNYNHMISTMSGSRGFPGARAPCGSPKLPFSSFPKDKCYPDLQYELTSVVISAFLSMQSYATTFLYVSGFFLINNICLRIISLDAYRCCILVHCTVIQFIHPFGFSGHLALLPVCDNYKQCFCGELLDPCAYI